MGIVEATSEYEKWLATQLPLVSADLAKKHALMASTEFAFLRATYYRWADRFPKLCPDAWNAPSVLSVADLHVENFGTWRDAEGRLVWGVNDFDEASILPYTNDLIRLATSIRIAASVNKLSIDLDEAFAAILKGYGTALKTERSPIVLSEDNVWLRAIAVNELRDPERFWKKMEKLPLLTENILQSGLAALHQALPGEDPSFDIRARQAGLGSLGRPRYVGLIKWNGGYVAREAKGICPSAVCWARTECGSLEILYAAIVHKAVRCADPFLSIDGNWVVRRLAPDCTKIELAVMPSKRDTMRMIEAMGRETANIHAGTLEAVPAILQDFATRSKNWLGEATSTMEQFLREDFRTWKRSYHA